MGEALIPAHGQDNGTGIAIEVLFQVSKATQGTAIKGHQLIPWAQANGSRDRALSDLFHNQGGYIQDNPQTRRVRSGTIAFAIPARIGGKVRGWGYPGIGIRG